MTKVIEFPVPTPILSPSTILAYNKCPKQVYFNKIEKRPYKGTMETLKGSFVHEILEVLFKDYPQGERNVDALKDISRDLWDSKWKGKLTGIVVGKDDQRDFRWQSWWLVESYLKMEDPNEVEPTALETWVDGSIISGIRVRGIVDRIVEDDGKLVIQDYKTGKAYDRDSPWDRDKEFPLMIYADLTEADTGQEVDRMELWYLSGEKIVTYEPTQEARERMYDMVIDTNAALTESCQTGDFPAMPSKLCDWCDHKPYCPAWN